MPRVIHFEIHAEDPRRAIRFHYVDVRLGIHEMARRGGLSPDQDGPRLPERAAGMMRVKKSSNPDSVRALLIKKRSHGPRAGDGLIERTTLFPLQVLQPLPQRVGLVLQLVHPRAQGFEIFGAPGAPDGGDGQPGMAPEASVDLTS